MTERENPGQKSNVSQIIEDIRIINRDLYHFHVVKERGQRLSDEDYAAFKDLTHEKSQRIIDLLIARTGELETTVIMSRFEDEQLHPFSMNRATIWIKSPDSDGANSEFPIRTELSDLRRPGVSDDSLQAKRLLGEIIETPEKPKDFFYRTIHELISIRDYRERVEVGMQEGYNIPSLDNISSSIVNQRLVGKRFEGAPFEIEVFEYLYRGQTREKVGIWVGEKRYVTYWAGKRLQATS
ncbi:MAG TPA: hypothetical protein VES68_00560 [Candidatus Sulfotelmatobacter sp.]|nr:hypothetical protein [Candidatus Sulfotelmatobacter sp.]